MENEGKTARLIQESINYAKESVGIDIFSHFACKYFGVNFNTLTEEMRSTAKSIMLKHIYNVQSVNIGTGKEVSIEKLVFIARIRYLGWLCYQMGADLPCEGNGEIPDEMLTSLIEGTLWALANPGATGEDNHKHWMEYKISQGWKYGDVLDRENKIHPDIVPYESLTPVEKRKDDMDLLMVNAANKIYEQLLNETCSDNERNETLKRHGINWE